MLWLVPLKVIKSWMNRNQLMVVNNQRYFEELLLYCFLKFWSLPNPLFKWSFYMLMIFLTSEGRSIIYRNNSENRQTTKNCYYKSSLHQRLLILAWYKENLLKWKILVFLSSSCAGHVNSLRDVKSIDLHLARKYCSYCVRSYLHIINNQDNLNFIQ